MAYRLTHSLPSPEKERGSEAANGEKGKKKKNIEKEHQESWQHNQG
jgi:hypothetical protein